MKISEVCSRTGLTERAVRLYIREGLVYPGQKNGITVFDAEGIARLEQIATLRRADFSISQIRRMLERPGEVGAVIDEKIGQLRQSIDSDQELLCALLPVKSAGSVTELVHRIRQSGAPQAEPIRTSFDEPVPSEADIQTAWQEIEAAERRKARHKKLIPLYIAASLVLLITLFVQYEKFDVYATQNSDSYPYLQEKLREMLENRDKHIPFPAP
ncbi:MAG: MerR family transcriptional regulator [Clostridia bacterium]|nr:MerR family transcriptional regulator [Clostridia bacterium]